MFKFLPSAKHHQNLEIDYTRLYAIKLVNSASKSKLIIRWLFGIVIASILVLFVPWQQNIDGMGVVTAFNPQERPQTIQTLQAGKIERWHVQEGQFVHKGDTILTISEIKDKFLDPKILGRMEDQLIAKENAILSKRDKVKALEQQISALKSQLNFSLNKARNKVSQYKMYVLIDSVEFVAANADNEIAKNQLQRQKKLFEQGLVSLTMLEQRNLKFQQTNAKYISAYNKFQASKNDLINTQIEQSSLRAEYADKISKSESDKSATLSDIFDSESNLYKQKIELSNMEIRNNRYIIRAPQDGYVVKAVKQGLGETVKEGEEIITIMPSNPHLAVELYIKPIDLPLVHKGCPVRLQFDGWPAIVFAGWPGSSVGTFGGKVQVIDYVNSNNGKFRVLVVPDSSDKPWPEQLRIGTGVMGWSMLDNVLLGYELWRQFNGFPPNFLSKLNKSTVTKTYTKMKGKKTTKQETKEDSDED
jgi:membrane fusion protein, adhesin transport system